MPALTIQCVNPPAYKHPPHVHIPNMGLMELAWDAVSAIPDPMDILSKFMTPINLALAQVRKYLQMVEALVAVKQCITAIPEAISTLNPTKITDCFKALVKAFAAVIADIPPIPYIHMAIDIASYFIDLIDEVLLLFARLDAKLTALINLRSYAQNLGDVELVNFANCGMRNVTLSMQQIMDLLKVIQPINDILMSVILRLIPTPEAQKAANDYATAALNFGSTQDILATADPTLGLPKLSLLLQSLGLARNAMVIVYNVLAPFVGEDADKEARSIPSFTNF